MDIEDFQALSISEKIASLEVFFLLYDRKRDELRVNYLQDGIAVLTALIPAGSLNFPCPVWSKRKDLEIQLLDTMFRNYAYERQRLSIATGIHFSWLDVVWRMLALDKKLRQTPDKELPCFQRERVVTREVKEVKVVEQVAFAKFEFEEI